MCVNLQHFVTERDILERVEGPTYACERARALCCPGTGGARHYMRTRNAHAHVMPRAAGPRSPGSTARVLAHTHTSAPLDRYTPADE